MRLFAMQLFAAEFVPERILRGFEFFLRSAGKIFACAIDVEIQHRHRGAIGARFAAAATFGGALERARDRLRTSQLENVLLQVEGAAALRDLARPFALR